MGTKWFKVQKTVSVQTVQRALNDFRRWGSYQANWSLIKKTTTKL